MAKTASFDFDDEPTPRKRSTRRPRDVEAEVSNGGIVKVGMIVMLGAAGLAVMMAFDSPSSESGGLGRVGLLCRHHGTHLPSGVTPVI